MNVSDSELINKISDLWISEGGDSLGFLMNQCKIVETIREKENKKEDEES